MSKSRGWCFTINNPTTTKLEWPDKVAYAVWQLEEVNTPHIQGYMEFKIAQAFSAIKKLLPTAHIEPRKGTPDEARDYAMKEESRKEGPWEFGMWSKKQGFRSDLAAPVEKIKEGASLKQIARDYPETYVKFHKGFAALKEQLRETPRDAGFEPREWQKKLMEDLSKEPDDRKVIWIYDPVGNVGKSRLARHLIMEHNAVALSGKVADMAYMYDAQPIVIFDVPRTCAQNVNHLYSLAEMLKSGVLFSTKYESKQKVFKPPHVVFFSNSYPDMEAWSADRYDIRQVSEIISDD